MTIQVYDSGTDKKATSLYAYDSGSDKSIQEVYAYDSGTDKKVFPSAQIFDDFEDGDRSEWSGDTFVAVVNTTKLEGSYAVKIETDEYIERSISESKPTKISFKFRVIKGGSYTQPMQFELYDSNGNLGGQVLADTDSKELRAEDGSGNVTVVDTYSEEITYDVTIIPDWSGGTYDVSFRSSSASNVGLAISSLDVIALSSYDPSGNNPKCHFDYITYQK